MVGKGGSGESKRHHPAPVVGLNRLIPPASAALAGKRLDQPEVGFINFIIIALWEQIHVASRRSSGQHYFPILMAPDAQS